jgi:hypothetical protein
MITTAVNDLILTPIHRRIVAAAMGTRLACEREHDRSENVKGAHSGRLTDAARVLGHATYGV